MKIHRYPVSKHGSDIHDLEPTPRMQMTTITIGHRYQVVIPKEERKRLGLHPASKVNVEARDRYLLLYPVTTKGMRGLGAEIANATDATDYVKKLRAAWG
ncbi:MAG: AbrB/MazE/SpoVT family DNA-binding domain-containing protein [bacterium]|nr:AbrB/MazE/SpoVT family DNA-binding domain-containing protein [bacterium]